MLKITPSVENSTELIFEEIPSGLHDSTKTCEIQKGRIDHDETKLSKNSEMASVKSNAEIIFIEIPQGLPDPTKNFEIRKGTIDLEKTELGKNKILVKTLYVSLDPYIRARLRDPSIISYFPHAPLNETMTGGIIAQVVKTNNTEYSIGDVVVSFGKWAEYSILDPGDAAVLAFGGVRKIPNPEKSPVPLSFHLSLIGMPGVTAYTGLHKICEPLTPGQTLYVSSAAGAVGQVVGQYAKALGLRVVGSAGNDKKVEYLLSDLGFDAAFNYKKHEDFDAILKETCPNGIDIYFENVGGKMLDAVLNNANDYARIAVCGMVSQYNRADNPEGSYALLNLVTKRIKMEGFISNDDLSKYGSDCIKVFTKLVEKGKLQYKEDVAEGIESLPDAFVGMLQGKNFGKAVVHVADPEF